MFPPQQGTPTLSGQPSPPLPPEVQAQTVQKQESSDSALGGLPRLVFSIERSLDTIADALPEKAEEIDGIKDSLRSILVGALQGGGSEEEGQGTPGLEPGISSLMG